RSLRGVFAKIDRRMATGEETRRRRPGALTAEHPDTSLLYAFAKLTSDWVNRSRNRHMQQPAPRDLFPGALEMMVLRLLQYEPLHGYALVQRIQQASNDLLRVEEGSLYPALQRLLRARLLRAEWSVSSTNRRVRIYRLTAA